MFFLLKSFEMCTISLNVMELINIVSLPWICKKVLSEIKRVHRKYSNTEHHKLVQTWSFVEEEILFPFQQELTIYFSKTIKIIFPGITNWPSLIQSQSGWAHSYSFILHFSAELELLWGKRRSRTQNLRRHPMSGHSPASECTTHR